jgi:tetratricopeptide (TPR) repeat protein
MRQLLGLTLLIASAASAGADEHLLAGARFFKEGRFSEALVEFRVAQRLGSGEAPWYAGASLEKLGRPEDALEAFAAGDPGSHDVLLDYYRALACSDARLYLCADALLASVGDRSGERIAGLVRQTREKIQAALRAGPSTGAIDWYHQRAAEAAARGRKTLAAAYLEEARGLAALRPDHHRAAEAKAGLAKLRAGSSR